MSTVIIRPFKPDEDSGVIYASWPNGAYYGSLEPIEERKSRWFKEFYSYMKDRLSDSEIIIACLKEDPTIIIGYAILSGTCLEWIYVKEAFRNQRIATLLLLNKPIDSVKRFTKIGYAIFNKEKHGRTEDRQEKQDL